MGRGTATTTGMLGPVPAGAAAFVVIAGFFGVELTYGLFRGSLALLSDAGHMAAAVYVVAEAVRCIGERVEVDTRPMLVVGRLGLVDNVVAMVLLRGSAAESLNVKGAYLEVVADTAGSVGVLVAGWLVWGTGEGYWDTVVALAIGACIAVRAVILGREVLAVLGQHAPAGVESTASPPTSSRSTVSRSPRPTPVDTDLGDARGDHAPGHHRPSCSTGGPGPGPGRAARSTGRRTRHLQVEAGQTPDCGDPGW